MTARYQTVWQSWNFVNRAAKPIELFVEADSEPQMLNDETRYKIQKARIEQRISIAKLAQMVKCDIETISAYERGDETLDTATINNIQRILDVEEKKKFKQ